MEFFKQNIIPGEVFVQLLAFLLVFWTLKILAWKPFLTILENRREKIRKDLEHIETARREVEKLKAEYGDHLQKIDIEARARIQEAVEEGRVVSREIQAKARAESHQLLEKTKESLDVEVAKARLELRREIAGLSLAVSERILKEKMSDPKSHEEKVLKIIEELENNL